MSRSWSEAVSSVLDLVSVRTGWEFPPTRWMYAEVSVRKALVKAKVAHIEDFVQLLERNEQALDALIEQLLIYETYFFRDRQHFQLITERWSEEMLALRGPHHIFKLWSAGCASGEEPYSLAIVIKELGWAARTRILATDLSRSALALARLGVYADWSLRESNSAFISTYFKPTADGRFAINEAIRKMVTFDYLNLNSGDYPSQANGTHGLDLILCRNVAIYLSQTTLVEVSKRLFASLADGGWLILGPSDPMLDGYAPFELKEINGVLVHKRPAAYSRATAKPPAPASLAGVQAATPKKLEHAYPESEIARKNDLLQLTQQVRTLLDSNQFDEAKQVVITARARFPFALEFIFLHMMISLGLQRHEEAAQLAGQLIFLDRTLAIAHFFRGSSLRAIGDIEGARRSFENALHICTEKPAGEPVAFSEGESHGRLGQATASYLAQLNMHDAADEKVR